MDTVDARAEELFVEALELDAAARAPWLESLAAREPDTASCVAALLAAHGRVDPVLDAPAALGLADLEILDAPTPPADPPSDRLDGLTFGAFRIVGHVGCGGAGDVYEAEQDAPRRRVALKVLRGAVPGSDAFRRFVREVDTLARLDHPAIARVFGAGVDGLVDGREVPWFAMELIPAARPITTWADERSASRRERVELFVPVCDAVHHAHRRGFLHRDLKPANLLAAGGDRTVSAGVKVIDFGVARVLESADDPGALERTQAGELLGTPLYMSPEQCAGRVDDLDVRTDVYSLGVVLYELVCGRLPQDLRQENPLTVLQRIRETPPTDPRTVVPNLDDDLAAILLRSLEKDPELRYDTAADLRDDLVRYLDHRPIEGRRSTTFHRVRLFARRRRALFAGLVTVGLLAAASLVTIVSLWLRSERFLADVATARSEADERARAVEQAHLDLRQLRATVSAVLDRENVTTAVLRSSSERIAQTQDAEERRRIMAQALARLAQVDAVLADEPEARAALAEAYEELGELHGVEWGASPADSKTSKAAFARAVELRRVLAAANPDDVEARGALSRALLQLVHSCRKQRLLAEGMPVADEAVATARAVCAERPDDDRWGRLLVTTLWARSDLFVIASGPQRERGTVDAVEALHLAEALFARAEDRDRAADLLAWTRFRFGLWLVNDPDRHDEAAAAMVQSTAEMLARFARLRDHSARLDLQTHVFAESTVLVRVGGVERAAALLELVTDAFLDENGTRPVAEPTERLRDVETWTRCALTLCQVIADDDAAERVRERIEDLWASISPTEYPRLHNATTLAAHLADAGVRPEAGTRALIEYALGRVERGEVGDPTSRAAWATTLRDALAR